MLVWAESVDGAEGPAVVLDFVGFPLQGGGGRPRDVATKVRFASKRNRACEWLSRISRGSWIQSSWTTLRDDIRRSRR